MAIDFPISPVLDDQFTADGKTWYWDGEKWIFASTTPETISAVSPITYETVTQTIGINESLISVIPTQVAGTAVVDSDSRLTDSRTPVSHSGSHESGGSDALTLSQSQITSLTADLSAKAPLDSPTFTGTPAAPTATANTNTTQIATTAFVTSGTNAIQSQLSNIEAIAMLGL